MSTDVGDETGDVIAHDGVVEEVSTHIFLNSCLLDISRLLKGTVVGRKCGRCCTRRIILLVFPHHNQDLSS